MKTLSLTLGACCICLLTGFSTWGFFAHQRINRLAVFTLPPEMFGFYKKNIEYITESAVSADRRRFFSIDEAPRHYIDLDHYSDTALNAIPKFWKEAVAKYSEDTLKAYGILPWHVNKVYYQLVEAFAVKDPENILRLSADIGHYIADGHVPLHTTENYNGQLTGQEGIHAFWESRLPELFSDRYDFFVGKAEYLSNPQMAIWKSIEESHAAVDSVLVIEKALAQKFGERKYAFETKGKVNQKVYAEDYAKAYHKILDGMVEKRMRASIQVIGSFWYSAWVDAGQPDISSLIDYQPSEEEIKKRKEEFEEWKKEPFVAGDHN